jgi:Na+-translocating ferredoxin:NAD+ oxidoreductase RnfG subunit
MSRTSWHVQSVPELGVQTMLSRRAFTLGLVITPVGGLLPGALCAQEGVFLTEAEASAAVFPHATAFDRTVVQSTSELRAKLRALLGDLRPSLWEPAYIIQTAQQHDRLLGYGVIVEEIGKHQPITFMVGVSPDGKVAEVAVMVYREPYGGQVRYERYLAQYIGKGLDNPLMPYRDIHNITGATLSCHSISRGVRKALALIHILFLQGKTP